jgi:soluble lytic murein transglycosylase
MRDIIVYGIQKLARQDATTALKLWRGFDAQQLFNDEDRRETHYQLAARLMRQDRPEAAEQLLSSIVDVTRADLGEWLIRDALRKQDWEKAYEWLARLPEDTQATERWSYWRARIMEELDIKEINGRAPKDIYASVATTRSFYGFLSADKLGYEYGLVDKPMPISEELLQQVENSPGIQRAREFFILGDLGAANREWYHTTRNMPTNEVVAAGRIANLWGWHRHGIQAMIDAQEWNDLQVRFPLAYQDQVAKVAQSTAINPLFLYAIARQESAFMADARSPVGAMGLMQLMPATAQQTAKRSGIAYTVQDLLKPEKNITLGGHYLNQLLGQFNGNRILAAAAYNAGPSRVKQWLSKDNAKLPYDVWIETIPFQETRGYVQNVLSFSVIYAYRTGTKQTFLTKEEANSPL